MLAKSPKYFADGEAVKQPAASATLSRNEYTRMLDDPDEQFAVAHDHETTTTTANLRDVWRQKLEDMSKEELIDLIRSQDDGSMPDCWKISTEPLSEKHYASFPTRLVWNCLAAGTSAKGYCPKCGGPVVRVIEAEANGGWSAKYTAEQNEWQPRGGGIRGKRCDGADNPSEHKTIGWKPSCTCPEAANPRPGLVLDPFAGSGRTGVEALSMGLRFVGVDLNPEYVSLAGRQTGRIIGDRRVPVSAAKKLV